MEEDEGELLVWKSDSAPQSMVSVTVGRVMTTLLVARPKKLHNAVSGFSTDNRQGASSLGPALISFAHCIPLCSFPFQYIPINCIVSTDSIHQSLWFLHQYVKDAVQNHVSLDEILIPMIEHVISFIFFSTFAHKTCESVFRNFKCNLADAETQG